MDQQDGVFRKKWKRFTSTIGKIFIDNYAILIFSLVIIIILVLIIIYGVTPVLVVLAPIPNYVYSAIKEYRQQIQFKNSGTSVKINDGDKLLFWILDGCNIPAFLEVAQKNPDLKTLFEEGYFAQCVTIFPSITPAAHSTLMTGCYPAQHRVPAFDWVEVTPEYSQDKKKKDAPGMPKDIPSVKKEYIRVMPDFKRYRQLGSSKKMRDEFFHGLGDAMALNQRFLSPMVTTIFEARKKTLYTASITEWIHRGADRFISQSISNLIEDFSNKNLIDNHTMTGLLAAFYKEASYEYGDFIWGSECTRQIDDLMVYWKSGTDTMSHEYGPDSLELQKEINDAIERLTETIRFYKMYSDQGLYVIISSDHSQSKVTQFSNLADDFKKTLGVTYKTAGQEDRSDEIIIQDAEIIFANNDRAALIYLFGPPNRKSAAENDSMEFLKKRTDVDLIFYKEDGTIQVIQVPGNGSCTEPEEIRKFFSGKDAEYPNAVERVEGLMNGDKWGDIVISMREGYSMNHEFKPANESDEMCHGDHGSLTAGDSLVPLLIWGPTIRPNIKEGGQWKTFRTVDIAPTIATIFKDTHPKTDGKSIKEIFIESAKAV